VFFVLFVYECGLGCEGIMVIDCFFDYILVVGEMYVYFNVLVIGEGVYLIVFVVLVDCDFDILNNVILILVMVLVVIIKLFVI